MIKMEFLSHRMRTKATVEMVVAVKLFRQTKNNCLKQKRTTISGTLEGKDNCFGLFRPNLHGMANMMVRGIPNRET